MPKTTLIVEPIFNYFYQFWKVLMCDKTALALSAKRSEALVLRGGHTCSRIVYRKLLASNLAKTTTQFKRIMPVAEADIRKQKTKPTV